MSDHKYNQNILIGAAVAAGILGTLTGLLGLKKTPKGWSEQAKDAANQVLESGDMVNKKMVLGGVAGGLVGAAAALLLAPKSGADLIKDIARPFIHEEEHKHAASHKAHPHKKNAPKKAAKSTEKATTSRKTATKTSEKKAHHTAAHPKKAPARRRTASAVSKAVAAAEKAEHDVKDAS